MWICVKKRVWFGALSAGTVSQAVGCRNEGQMSAETGVGMRVRGLVEPEQLRRDSPGCTQGDPTAVPGLREHDPAVARLG